MPSLAQALAAVVAQASTSEVAPGQLAAFPGFLFPVPPEALTADGEPASFDFMHRINMIPHHPPAFPLSADLVWDVYGRILTERALAKTADGREVDVVAFAAAKARLGDGEITLSENGYFTTAVTPTDLDAAHNWTDAAIGSEVIGPLAQGLAPAEQAWMARFNVLPMLGDDLIESVRFQRAALVVLRPWFDASIFDLHGWDLPGAPVSDGGDPPSGRLPALVVKLVVVRGLRFKLAATRLPDTGPTIVFRRVDGVDVAPPALPAVQLLQISASDLRPMLLTRPLRADAGPITEQIKAMAFAVAEETGARALDVAADAIPRDKAEPVVATAAPALPGAQRFHVPFTFDTTAAWTLARDEQVAANAALAAREAERQRLQATIDALRGEVARLTPQGRPHDRWWRILTPAKRLLLAKQAELAAAETQVPAADEALAAAQREQLRARRACQLLEQLDAVTADDKAYVLSLICDRIPKAPDRISA